MMDRTQKILIAAAIILLFIVALLLPVAADRKMKEDASLRLPEEGTPLVMVWTDDAVPRAHVALRRGSDYFAPGPGGELLETEPPSYWEELR